MRVFALAAISSVLAVVLAGCPDENDSEPSACVGAQALSAAPINGTSLAAKQLALTFDDGPGDRTGELSTYLKSQGIRAAFFVNGKNVVNPAILAQLVADGHVVGNHTETHLSLTGVTDGQPRPADATVIAEVTQTDTKIAPYVVANRFLFRAPYGDFDTTTYNTLQGSPMKKYVGHIDWDIGWQYVANVSAADFACWQTYNHTSKECGDLYVKDSDAVGKGIVLLHDPYGNLGNTDVNTGVGNTIDMIKYIVPILKAKGYTFVRVDEVPAIASLLPPLPPPDAGPDAAPDASSSSSSSSSGATSSSSGGSSGNGPPPDAGNPCPPAGTTSTRRLAPHAH